MQASVCRHFKHDFNICLLVILYRFLLDYSVCSKWKNTCESCITSTIICVVLRPSVIDATNDSLKMLFVTRSRTPYLFWKCSRKRWHMVIDTGFVCTLSTPVSPLLSLFEACLCDRRHSKICSIRLRYSSFVSLLSRQAMNFFMKFLTGVFLIVLGN